MTEKQPYASMPTAPQPQQGNVPPPYAEAAASSGMPAPSPGHFESAQQGTYSTPYPQQQQPQPYPQQPPQQQVITCPAQHVPNQPIYPAAGCGTAPPPDCSKGMMGATQAPTSGAPPPPPQMQPQHGQAIQHQTIIVQSSFGRNPTPCVCPQCHQSVVTTTIREIGLFVWLIAGLILLVGGWVFCLCFIPFCVDDMKDVRHQCPNCHHTIANCKRA